MWRAEVGTSAEGFRVSNSLQQLSLGAARRPPDRLLAAPPPSLAGGGAGLALYVQTPDQPHSGHYVKGKWRLQMALAI